jgi:hypothetical protein
VPGAWLALVWQLAHAAWPVPFEVAVRSAWQLAQKVGLATGFGPCAAWQPLQVAWPVPAVDCERSAWQRAQVAAVGRGLPPWGTWQSRHGAVACEVAG